MRIYALIDVALHEVFIGVCGWSASQKNEKAQYKQAWPVQLTLDNQQREPRWLGVAGDPRSWVDQSGAPFYSCPCCTRLFSHFFISTNSRYCLRLNGRARPHNVEGTIRPLIDAIRRSAHTSASEESRRSGGVGHHANPCVGISSTRLAAESGHVGY